MCAAPTTDVQNTARNEGKLGVCSLSESQQGGVERDAPLGLPASRHARTYLEKYYESFANCTRDQVIVYALQALQDCLLGR